MAVSCTCVPFLLPSVECVHLSVNLSVDARLCQCVQVSMYHIGCKAFLYISSLVRQLELGMSWDAG